MSSLSQPSAASGYLSRTRADQVKFKSPPTYRRTDREIDADLSVSHAPLVYRDDPGDDSLVLRILLQALEKEDSQAAAFPARSLRYLGSPSERKLWHSKDCPCE